MTSIEFGCEPASDFENSTLSTWTVKSPPGPLADDSQPDFAAEQIRVLASSLSDLLMSAR